MQASLPGRLTELDMISPDGLAVAYQDMLNPEIIQMPSEEQSLVESSQLPIYDTRHNISSDMILGRSPFSEAITEAIESRLNQTSPPDFSGNVEIFRIQPGPKSIIDNCAICKEDFNRQAANTCFIDCAHWYHLECVVGWFDRGTNKCPECRHPTNKIYKVVANTSLTASPAS